MKLTVTSIEQTAQPERFMVTASGPDYRGDAGSVVFYAARRDGFMPGDEIIVNVEKVQQ